MARTESQRTAALDDDILLVGSRLRLRSLAIINGAMHAQQITTAELARRLGVRPSTVLHTLDGNGDFRLQTLAEYLGALGVEVELVPVERGEIAASMNGRRAPSVLPVTMRDRDLRDSWSTVCSSEPKAPQVWGAPSAEQFDPPRSHYTVSHGLQAANRSTVWSCQRQENR